jgi:hypothetical protein
LTADWLPETPYSVPIVPRVSTCKAYYIKLEPYQVACVSPAFIRVTLSYSERVALIDAVISLTATAL